MNYTSLDSERNTASFDGKKETNTDGGADVENQVNDIELQEEIQALRHGSNKEELDSLPIHEEVRAPCPSTNKGQPQMRQAAALPPPENIQVVEIM